MCKVVAMKRSTMSMEQAKVEFFRNCIAVCGSDVITVRTAIKVLDNDSVEYALSPNKGGAWWNLYGLGKFGDDIKYLTYKGFIEAVGYFNIKQEYLCEVVQNE